MTAKQLAYNWYMSHREYFISIGSTGFDWEAMGEISQEYWIKQAGEYERRM